MPKLVKHVENKSVNYLIVLDRDFPVMNRPGETAKFQMDVTDAIWDGIKADRKLRGGYDPEAGPNFAFEVQRAMDYAEYVQGVATYETVHRFSIPWLFRNSPSSDARYLFSEVGVPDKPKRDRERVL